MNFDGVERCSKCGNFSQKSIFRKSSTSQYGLNPHCKTYRKPTCTGKREKQLDQHKNFSIKRKRKDTRLLRNKPREKQKTEGQLKRLQEHQKRTKETQLILKYNSS